MQTFTGWQMEHTVDALLKEFNCLQDCKTIDFFCSILTFITNGFDFLYMYIAYNHRL